GDPADPVAPSVSLTGIADYHDGSGVFTLADERLRYLRPAAPLPPFAARVDLTVRKAVLTDDDGACHDVEADGVCDDYTIGAIGGTELRQGRLRLESGSGSELRPVELPVRVEHWQGIGGSGGFAVNVDDACTAIGLSQIELDAYTGR